MATYNGERYLRPQLDSLLHQDIALHEIIVCDDRSSDGTQAILEEYRQLGRIKVFVNDKSLGVVKNFERAISLCTGNYVALSDQDDVWLPDKLSSSLHKMHEIEIDKAKPTLVYTDLEVVDQDLNTISLSFWKHLLARPESETFYTLLFGNVVTGCTILMNRAMVDRLSTIPNRASMHDHWAALIAYGFGQFGFIDRPLIKYRQHGSNITNNYERNLRNRIAGFFEEVGITRKQITPFLQREIDQAKQFKLSFESELEASVKQSLLKFIALERASFATRKWKSFMSNNSRTN